MVLISLGAAGHALHGIYEFFIFVSVFNNFFISLPALAWFEWKLHLNEAQIKGYMTTIFVWTETHPGQNAGPQPVQFSLSCFPVYRTENLFTHVNRKTTEIDLDWLWIVQDVFQFKQRW